MVEPVCTREEALRRLRQLTPELFRFGVRALALFGSFARGESGPESDVDIRVEFEGPARFDRFMELRRLLEGTLGRRVDLVTHRALKPRLKQRIEREELRVA